VLCSREYKHRRDGAFLENVLKQILFVLPIDEIYELTDRIYGRARGRNVDPVRLLQHFVCKLGNVRRHGRREHQRLTAVGRFLYNAAYIVDEAHVKHTVRLVENEDVYLGYIDKLLPHEIPKTTGRGDEDIDTLGERGFCDTPPNTTAQRSLRCLPYAVKLS